MRKVICCLIILFSLSWASAANAALALDGNGAAATSTTATSKAFSITTTNANDIIVVVVLSNTNATGAARTVSSVTSSGLSFSKRGGVSQVNSLNDGQDLEWWYAVASSPLTAQSITVTLSGAPDLMTIIAFAVSGANTSTPWDTASASGFTGNNATATNNRVQVAGVSTTQANTFAFSFVSIDANAFSAFPCATGAFTEIALPNANLDTNNSNNTWGNLGGDYQVYAAAQSSFTWQYKTGGSFDSASR